MSILITKYFLIGASKDHVLKGVKKFTAIGQVVDEEPYQLEASANFKPYRRKIEFKESHKAEIRPLLDQLSFIKNKKKWGFYLISGFSEIPQEDFILVQKAMRKRLHASNTFYITKQSLQVFLM